MRELLRQRRIRFNVKRSCSNAETRFADFCQNEPNSTRSRPTAWQAERHADDPGLRP